MPNGEQYAHVLLFACTLCGRPLSSTCLSTRSNLEIAEAEWFTPHCPCGWSGDIAGVTAAGHWVKSWHADVPTAPGEPGICDGPSLNREAR
jgi:hypothetical protein